MSLTKAKESPNSKKQYLRYNMRIKNNRGFTLIELLVVIAIIGILAGIVLTSLGAAKNKAKDVALKEQMSDLRNAIELYATINGSYDGLFPLYNQAYYFRCTNSVIAGTNLPDYNADSSLKTSLTEIAKLTGCTNTGNDFNQLCIYCKNDANRYIVMAKLPSSPTPVSGKSDVPAWCIDSTGMTKKTAYFALGENLLDERYTCVDPN